MRVWLVNPYAVPPGKGGTNRHHSIASELTRLGHQVLIVSSGFDHFSRKQFFEDSSSWVRIENEEGQSYAWISTPSYAGNGSARLWNMLVFGCRLFFHRKKLARKWMAPDVVVGSSLHLLGAFASFWAARCFRSGFVLEIRDIWPATLIELFGMSKRHPFVLLNGWLERFLYRNSKQIVSTMPNAESHFRSNGAGEATSISWIPNGFGEKRLPPSLASTKEESKVELVYAGGMGDANGLFELLDGLKLWRQKRDSSILRVTLYGDGPQRQDLIEETKKLGLEKIVSFPGRIPKNEVLSVLRQADGLLLFIKASPIYRWGYSMNKLSDYLLAGRPIIVSDVCSYNPIEDAEAGFSFEPGDADSFMKAIDGLVGLDLPERHRLGMNGYRYAIDQLDYRQLVVEYEAILKGVLPNPAPPGTS